MRSNGAGRRPHLGDERVAIGAIAVAAALVVEMVFDHSPVGVGGIDEIYSAIAVVVVVLAGSTARRWTWAFAAFVVALAAAGPAGAVGAGVALVGGVVGLRRRRRLRTLGALVGAAIAWAASALDTFDTAGAASALAVLACAPMLVSAYGLSSSRSRRAAARVGVVATLAAAGAAVVGLLVLGPASRDATAAASLAQRAMGSLEQGDSEAASADLRAASRAFERVRGRTSGPLGVAGDAIPILSHQIDAIDRLASSGASLSDATAAALARVDPASLVLDRGRFDLDRLPAAQGALDDLEAVVDAAADRNFATDRTWLTPTVDGAVEELDVLLGSMGDDLDTARAAIDAMPALLGADGPRRYAVLFTSPSEARDFGGFTGSVALLTADAGSLEMTGPFDATDLTKVLGDAGVEPIEDLSAQYRSARPWRFVQNWTATAHLAEIRDVVAELAPATLGLPVDGVFVVDPYVLGALVDLVGPVTVPGVGVFDEALTTADHLLRGQYVGVQDQVARRDLLGQIGRDGFDALVATSRPSIPRLVELFGPLAAQGRLAVSVNDSEVDALLARLGLQPVVEAFRGDRLHVSQANNRSNKLDAYLARDLSYDVDIDESTGDARATLRLRVRNQIDVATADSYVLGRPSEGSTPGTNRATFSVYTPFEMVGMEIDGTAGAGASAIDARAGLWRHEATVEVPPGQEVVVEMALAGRLAPGVYRARISVAPGASIDDFALDIRSTSRKISLTRGRMSLVAPIHVEMVSSPDR